MSRKTMKTMAMTVNAPARLQLMHVSWLWLYLLAIGVCPNVQAWLIPSTSRKGITPRNAPLFTEKATPSTTTTTCLSAEKSTTASSSSSHILVSQVPHQPSYSMAGTDLSQLWIDLVHHNHVQTKVEPSDDTFSSSVDCQYGIQLVPMTEDDTNNTVHHDSTATTPLWKCQPFVQQIHSDPTYISSSTNKDDSIHPRIREMQHALQQTTIFTRQDGPFVAQLQLLRTLRPPPSAGFDDGASSTTKSSNIPPPYDATTDSFVTGPLRLELRPKTATLTTESPQRPLITPWDVYHNVSPADTRGHFLLIPTIQHESNWRAQTFTPSDAHDILHLVASIHPVGSTFVGFNSVGAAASQNHIHCHAWPILPCSYAVTQVQAIRDFCDIGHIQVSWLSYPVMCLHLSTTTTTHHLSAMATVLTTILDTIGEAPYNVGFLNRNEEQHDEKEDDYDTDEFFVEATATGQAHEASTREPMPPSASTATAVDVYVFVRSKERSSLCPALKLGISEMMGVFHAQSLPELEFWCGIAEEETTTREKMRDEDHDDHDHDLKFDGPMAQALEDVSYEDEDTLWERVCEELQAMEYNGKL